MVILNFEPLDGQSGEIRCVAKCVPLHMQGNAASTTAARAKGGFVRIFQVRAERSESAVWIPPGFARLNGRFGENRCAAEVPVLRARANAASAIAATA
jgi:hypothetical protein